MRGGEHVLWSEQLFIRENSIGKRSMMERLRLRWKNCGSRKARKGSTKGTLGNTGGR